MNWNLLIKGWLVCGPTVVVWLSALLHGWGLSVTVWQQSWNFHRKRQFLYDCITVMIFMKERGEKRRSHNWNILLPLMCDRCMLICKYTDNNDDDGDDDYNYYCYHFRIMACIRTNYTNATKINTTFTSVSQNSDLRWEGQTGLRGVTHLSITEESPGTKWRITGQVQPGIWLLFPVCFP